MSFVLELNMLCFCILLFLIRLQDVEKLKYSVPRKEKSFSKEKKEEDDGSSEERNFRGSHQGLAFIE